ncbi:hypothetical protein W97_02585 [Coniosporium apollinis CBS 100218]|uniref:NB-ARC domain-containing protein n=1 Tax=Coniosporium apollinis (strain CBS 100218) TaxID=1168221 RepID=R7YNB0_CONA1|nr:uncharacterized protein W97_02585 [Coniosporium apollinis CBS 100218]EON63358.1 hypothetical protein W97_02585 [Coniosporium apollinis CBS 100218]
MADLLSSNGGCSTLSDSSAEVTYVKDTIRTWTGRWLLVFDNYDTPCAFTNIAEYFPTAAGDPPNTILVTSRQLECGGLGAHIKVSGPTEAEGLELLISRSGATSGDPDRFARQPKWGKVIVNKLGYLLLAIDQAAAYITIRQLSLKTFLQQLKSRKRLILASAPTTSWEYRKRSDDDNSLRGEHLSVLTTWGLSFDQISGPDPGATRAFLILSAFLNRTYNSEIVFRNFVERSIVGGDGIAWAEQFFLDRRRHSFQFQDTIAALANLSLIQGISFTGQEVGFSLHPLVKEWLQLRCGLRTQKRLKHEAILMTVVLVQTKESDGLPLHTRRDLLSNIDCCMENSRTSLQTTEDKVAYSGILEGHTTTFATFYGRHDLHTAAEELFLESVRFQNNDASTVLRTMNNLGALCIDMSKTREAEHVLGLVLAAKELTLGRDHFRTLNTVNNLENVFTAQLLFDKATDMYQRVLAGYRKTFGNAHHSIIQAYNNLAELAMKRGDFKGANGLLDSVLDAAKACNKGDSDLVIYIESNVPRLT